MDLYMFRNCRTFWHVTCYIIYDIWSCYEGLVRVPFFRYRYRYKYNTDTVQMISHNTVHYTYCTDDVSQSQKTSSAPPISDCWQLPTVPATQSTRIFHCHCNNYIEFLGDFFRKLIQILKYDLSYKSLSSVLLLLLWLIFDELICVLKYSL